MTRIEFPGAHQYRPDFPHRISNYCRPGAKILIQLDYGLGDVLMIYPHYCALKEMYPETRIDFKTIPCFRSLFPAIESDDFYDYVFQVHAYFNERVPEMRGKTKPQCTCELNFGIPYDPSRDFTRAPKCGCSLVGFNFLSSNWLWKTVSCPYNTAKLLWEKTEDAGFICIDLFYPKDAFAARPENKKYDFVDLALRDKKTMTVQKMFDIVNGCVGIASISTGTYHMAMNLCPETTLYLKNEFSRSNYSRDDKALSLDVNKPDDGIIREWHRRMREAIV